MRDDMIVQASSESDMDSGAVKGIAAEGLSGAGSKLPHLDKIQHSFGRHDVSGVSAHVGGAAEKANSRMGSLGYATGNSVAFKKDPSVHLAAHEAAHTVQQKGGVQCKDGVGQVGDQYEQHADQVADLVVQGKSAEGLLDKYAGGGSSGGAVQQKTTSAPVQHKGGPVQFEDDEDTPAGEEEGAWLAQKSKTAHSFHDLIRANLLAADAFKTTAEVVDPPPAWQTALKVVGTVVLAAALGGVGGIIAGKLISEATKPLVKIAIEAAITGGQKAAEEGVNLAISNAPDSDKAPLVAFCENQKDGMNEASGDARDSFMDGAGTHTNQNLTIAEMTEIWQANKDSMQRAREVQMHQMTIGWANMVAGNNAVNDKDVEDTTHQGILGLVISGSNDRPISVVRAEIEGINSALRNKIKGSKVSEWVTTTGKQSLDVVVKTGDPNSASDSFDVSAATTASLKSAGHLPSHRIRNGKGNIYFAYGKNRDSTSTYYIDSNTWGSDHGWGADAGRWFLRNVTDGVALINQMGNLTIPSVNT